MDRKFHRGDPVDLTARVRFEVWQTLLVSLAVVRTSPGPRGLVGAGLAMLIQAP